MREYYGHEMPPLLRLIGCNSVQERGRLWRMKWGEVSFGTWGIALDYQARAPYDDHRPHVRIRIPGLHVFIYTPWDHVGGEHCMDAPNWGFYYSDKALVLKWGKKSKYLHMPWDWQHVRHDIFMADGTWHRNAKEPWDLEGKWLETHDYHYYRKSGAVQERKATIGVEEREWRWRWLTWLPFPRMIRRCITVEFSDEVGERSGSWKGGTTGCGYDLREGESPLQCLRRMERERKF